MLKRYADCHKEEKRKYYLENKEAILEKREKPVKCVCGKIVQHRQMAAHKRSNRHREALEKEED